MAREEPKPHYYQSPMLLQGTRPWERLLLCKRRVHIRVRLGSAPFVSGWLNSHLAWERLAESAPVELERRNSPCTLSLLSVCPWSVYTHQFSKRVWAHSKGSRLRSLLISMLNQSFIQLGLYPMPWWMKLTKSFSVYSGVARLSQ